MTINSSSNNQYLTTLPPALAHCEKCLAVSKAMRRNQKQQIYCPVCRVEYVFDGNFKIEPFRAYFRKRRLYIDIDSPIEHIKHLGLIANRMQQDSPNYPPLKGLFESINEAQKFIHFTTFGINQQILGALKLAAQRIQVRGIVSLPPDQAWLLPELECYRNEAPGLTIKTVCASSRNWEELPHQKLVVIDGLLAFKGSVNLTPTAWRKAARGYDEVEVLTDVEKVIDQHNRYFSPVWADLSEYGDAIAISNSVIDGSAA
ncbi:MAG TPA: phospholipase D-like domain-containing protein [Candidatus Sericytochromatia bacterium]